MCHNPSFLPATMLSKIREILLTQYIGSILIALLVWQAVIEVVVLAARTGFWVYDHVRNRSVLDGSSGAPYPWDSLVFTAVIFLLYLLTAYALARWLYPPPNPITHIEGGNESPTTASDSHG